MKELFRKLEKIEGDIRFISENNYRLSCLFLEVDKVRKILEFEKTEVVKELLPLLKDFYEGKFFEGEDYYYANIIVEDVCSDGVRVAPIKVFGKALTTISFIPFDFIERITKEEYDTAVENFKKNCL